MTRPALTCSIASLEHQLGVRLFHRDKRRVALTVEGSDLLARARRLLAGVDQFAFAAHSLRAASQQILRLGVYGNGLAQLTPLLFQEFRQRYPEVRLEVLDADRRSPARARRLAGLAATDVRSKTRACRLVLLDNAD